ncbi:hypothetical protein OMAG_001820 [Candidatus Omnitrophus magneticus]|uniref:Uncharacterized protein n=1 Tax=Candidatus Omnitrophus magneticus TaxID=1609969 RepID=A0A0F0CM87_9BACT|nr:hypothetical protein OMAG_001820 [Candidatus Omnitrophus magneticus]
MFRFLKGEWRKVFRLLQIVFVFMIITQVSLSDSIECPHDFQSRNSLAIPQNYISPITRVAPFNTGSSADAVIFSSEVLKARLIYNLKESYSDYIDLFFNKIDSSSEYKGIKAILEFSRAVTIPLVWTKKRKLGIESMVGEASLTVIPAIINNVRLYIYLKMKEEKIVSIDVFEEKEHLGQVKELLDKGFISREQGNGLIFSVAQRSGAPMVLDSMDESVLTAKLFFSKLFGADGEKIFNRAAIKDGRIWVEPKGILISGGIVIPEETKKEDRPWQIIEGLIRQVDSKISACVLGEMEGLFKAFIKDGANFASEFFLAQHSDLMIMIKGLTEVLQKAGNEKTLAFDSSVYEYVPVFDDIKHESALYQNTLRKIKNIFMAVSNNEAKRYQNKNMLWKVDLLDVVRMDTKRVEDLWAWLKKEGYIGENGEIEEKFIKLEGYEELVLPEQFSKIKEEVFEILSKAEEEKNTIKFAPKVIKSAEDIDVRELTPCLLPTEIVEIEGGKNKIILNDNFVKVMCKLSEIGMAGPDGDIYETPYDRGERGSRRLGNMWETLLYSTALHVIRGHFRIVKGSVVFNPYEAWAQGERGNKYGFINILSIIYYWFEIVGKHYQFWGMRIEGEVDEYPPYLTRNITREAIMAVKERVGKSLFLEFLDRHIYSGNLKYRETGYTEKEYEKFLYGEDITTESLFYFLARQKQPLTFFEILDIQKKWNNKGSARRYLDIFTKLGIVTVKDNPESKGLDDEKVYKLIPLPSGLMKQVEKDIIKDKINTSYDIYWEASKEAISKVRESLIMLMEPYRVKEIIEEVKKYNIATKTKENPKGEKLYVFLDTSWIPKEQRELEPWTLIWVEDGEETIMGKSAPEVSGFSEFITSFKELKKTGSFELITGNGEELVTKFKDMIKEKKITNYKNVILISERELLYSTELKTFISDTIDKFKQPFVVGVDARDIRDMGEDTTTELSEILAMAIKMARKPKLIADSARVMVQKKNSRFIIVIPKAEKVESFFMNSLYKNNAKIIYSA